MANNNQHFKTRATTVTKGVFEVAPSESTILAKSLVDIDAMLKVIKEGQQVTLKLLTQHTNTSQQLPVKHCGICSCNSHHTDECPQMQEDNTVATSHNLYENQQPPPNNRQYYTQPKGGMITSRTDGIQLNNRNKPNSTNHTQPQNLQNPRY
ncbi:hypothetical protein PIB30_058784 [Stylosanthes scabra]|uniref:Uncharacterized protein n=1 Tax=Stylosanthes scabra TaxID=79078 RepID=A0ABU6VJW1_9FABA|nr:hypothetical protein [Stylosanthes scabra]